jgi:uncharacterized phage infection (PIP) family protein YhgE
MTTITLVHPPSTIATLTPTATPERFFLRLKFPPPNIEAVVQKLIASQLFNVDQQNRIRAWYEIFKKRFSEIPKENADKERAAYSIFYLLEKFIRPNYGNPALADKISAFEEEIENNIQGYLPEGKHLRTWLSEVRASESKRASFHSKVQKIERLYQQTMSQLQRQFMDKDAEIEHEFETLKKRIDDLLDSIQNSTPELRAKLIALNEEIRKICPKLNAAAEQQQKIDKNIQQLNIIQKANAEAAQKLAEEAQKLAQEDQRKKVKGK